MSKIKLAAVVFALVANQAVAQSALERHSWQSLRPLEPLSRTAIAITGPVRVSAQAISFNGKPVPAALRGMYWRVWDDAGGEKDTAGIYELKGDPGRLRQGNTLCGDERARYVVLWDDHDALTGGAVKMAVYSSSAPPQDRDSPGLCGTYSYAWRVR